MRAWKLQQPAKVESSPLALEETPTPTPSRGQVLIRVSCCGICRTDLHVVEGELPVKRPHVTLGHQVVGTVVQRGEDVTGLNEGDRVGVAWLHSTCGACRYCLRSQENLCENAKFTGWTTDGGYAEYILARADFVYPTPAGFTDTQAAPLLCAGIIGYRALKLTNIADWSGSRLGIYGFGAAGHVCIQLARHRGAEVYVATRDRERHQALATELGAMWVGDTFDAPPVLLDAGIVFAPAGEIVPAALKALDKGGTLVLGGIHMTPIPEFAYDLIYGERMIRSVANNTRHDGHEFLKEAAAVPIRTSVESFPFTKANEALLALKSDAIRGAAVLVADQS